MARSETYKQFTDKFKPKLTTDDCFTPEAVYDAVLKWASDEYDFDPSRAVRPFWPEGDYQSYDYEPGDVVVDNPPFSILSAIVDWYCEHGIKFFLFAPSMTNFNVGIRQFDRVTHLMINSEIVYQNGAKVRTCFLTNMDDCVARAVPELSIAIKRATKTKDAKPKYSYPANVIRTTDLQRMVRQGASVKIPRGHAKFIRKLDSQSEAKKTIFGGALLVSDEVAGYTKRYKAPVEDAIEWTLSDREREEIKQLGE